MWQLTLCRGADTGQSFLDRVSVGIHILKLGDKTRNVFLPRRRIKLVGGQDPHHGILMFQRVLREREGKRWIDFRGIRA